MAPVETFADKLHSLPRVRRIPQYLHVYWPLLPEGAGVSGSAGGGRGRLAADDAAETGGSKGPGQRRQSRCRRGAAAQGNARRHPLLGACGGARGGARAGWRVGGGGGGGLLPVLPPTRSKNGFLPDGSRVKGLMLFHGTHLPPSQPLPAPCSATLNTS